MIGFSWSSSPSCTELETIVMNWLGKMSGLDQSFLPFLNGMSSERQKNDIEHTGGGVILVFFKNKNFTIRLFNLKN